MQDLSIRKTRELSPVAKEVFETMLGRRLRDDEEVAIWASRAHQPPVGTGRADAWRQLNQHLERMASKVTGSPDDLERVVDEVCDQVRHGPQ
jgi:hypothetical protein